MKMVANETELRNALKERAPEIVRGYGKEKIWIGFESKSTWKDACNGFWASCESLYEPDR
jgi:hypothetical protein